MGGRRLHQGRERIREAEREEFEVSAELEDVCIMFLGSTSAHDDMKRIAGVCILHKGSKRMGRVRYGKCEMGKERKMKGGSRKKRKWKCL